MIELIHDNDTIDGWFLFDNGAVNASQDVLLKNQTVYQQLSHIHGDLGTDIAFGLRTKFDEDDPSVKRLEVINHRLMKTIAFISPLQFYPAGLAMTVNDYLSTDQDAERVHFC